MRIEVTERGRRQLTEQEGLALGRSESLWSLASAGYFSVRRTGRTTEEIVGHRYVGRAVSGDDELVITEKVRGALRALVGAATGAELHIEEASSPLTEFDVVSRHLMTEFTRVANKYVSERRVPRYDYRDASGPLLGGSIDIARTIRLHASGRPQDFAFSEGRVVRDSPLDRLVLGALTELDAAAPFLELDAETLYLSRTLAGALEEIRDEQFLQTTTADHLEAAYSIERDEANLPADRDLARLASIALLHQGFELDAALTGTVPRAWFVDLETLFESAVRTTLSSLLPEFAVDRGEEFERRMFTDGLNRSRANPDVVIHTAAGPMAVGDAKYKSLRLGLADNEDDGDVGGPQRKKAGRPDLYQVLVHAAAVGATTAFLVYASDATYDTRRLGISATGCTTWITEVRPSHLKADLATFVAEALASQPQLAAA